MTAEATKSVMVSQPAARTTASSLPANFSPIGWLFESNTIWFDDRKA